MNQDWRQSWPVALAALASAVFLVLWLAVDDNFYWGFFAFLFLTALLSMRETRDWPRSPLAWMVWLIAIAFLVLARAVDENLMLPFYVFLFLAIAMRAREARPPRGENADQGLR